MSPTLVIFKADGSICCFIDYRKANTMFEGYNFPINSIDNLTDKVQ